MIFTTLGADRVLHEGAGYRHECYRIPSYPIGSRERPSGAKLEDAEPVYIPSTAQWLEKEDNEK